MAEQKTSFWKKEISLGRKKPIAGYLDPEAVSARDDRKPSVWKKGAHLRKPKADRAAQKAAAKQLQADRKADEQAAKIARRAAQDAEKAAKAAAERRQAEQKASDEAVRRAEKEARKAVPRAPKARKPERAAPVATAGEKTSIWKKEISFGRKKAASGVAAPAARVEIPKPVAPVAPPPHVQRVAEPTPVAEVKPIKPAAAPDPVAPPAAPDPATPPAEERPVSMDWTLVAASDPAPAPCVDPPTRPAPPKPVLVEEDVVTLEPDPVAPVALFNPGAAPKPVVFEEETQVLPAPAAVEPVPVTPEPVAPQLVPAPAAPPAPAASEPVPAASPAARSQEKSRSRLLGRKKGSAPKSKEKKSGKGAKKIVGVKIGASQISAARVSNNGSVELHQIAREPLEPGIVVAGELRDPDALAAALKSFFKKHKLPKRGIRLGISNNRIGVRLFEISSVEDGDQLRNAVRFRAQDALPISVDDAVMDFHVVGETVDADGAPAKRVVLVVAYRDLIERYADAFRKAGLKLIGVDLEAFALLRSLGVDPDPMLSGEDRTGLVVASVGHDRSTFAVSDGRVCEFTRVLDWGGSTLDAAIGGALELAPADARAVKLRLSLADASAVPANLTPEQAEAAREAVRRALEAFARDLVSSLRFYQSQPDSLSIRELVLSGGTAELPGLAAELERLLDVRVRVGDPLGRVKVGRRVKQREGLGSLAAAIGLGIED